MKYLITKCVTSENKIIWEIKYTSIKKGIIGYSKYSWPLNNTGVNLYIIHSRQSISTVPQHQEIQPTAGVVTTKNTHR